jgi:hypothetical protein
MRSSWIERYLDLVDFVKNNGRMPSRRWALTQEEQSLAWWVKDQRRKMRLAPTEVSKRGRLTPEQREKLLELGIEPHYQPPEGTSASAGRSKRPVSSARKPVENRTPARGRAWSTRLEALATFLDTHRRPPVIVYTAPPAEVKLARWLADIQKAVKRPRARLSLTSEERELFEKAGVVFPQDE